MFLSMPSTGRRYCPEKHLVMEVQHHRNKTKHGVRAVCVTQHRNSPFWPWLPPLVSAWCSGWSPASSSLSPPPPWDCEWRVRRYEVILSTQWIYSQERLISRDIHWLLPPHSQSTSQAEQKLAAISWGLTRHIFGQSVVLKDCRFLFFFRLCTAWLLLFRIISQGGCLESHLVLYIMI